MAKNVCLLWHLWCHKCFLGRQLTEPQCTQSFILHYICSLLCIAGNCHLSCSMSHSSSGTTSFCEEARRMTWMWIDPCVKWLCQFNLHQIATSQNHLETIHFTATDVCLTAKHSNFMVFSNIWHQPLPGGVQNDRCLLSVFFQHIKQSRLSEL